MSHASFNEATHIVNYSIEIVPGPLYKMGVGSVRWRARRDGRRNSRVPGRLAPGAAFDESYVSSFAAQAQKKDKALAKWMQTVITTFDVKPDPDTHQVNLLFHFAKAAQGGR